MLALGTMPKKVNTKVNIVSDINYKSVRIQINTYRESLYFIVIDLEEGFLALPRYWIAKRMKHQLVRNRQASECLSVYQTIWPGITARRCNGKTNNNFFIYAPRGPFLCSLLSVTYLYFLWVFILAASISELNFGKVYIISFLKLCSLY